MYAVRNRLYGRSRSSRGTGFRLELTATPRGAVEEGIPVDVFEGARVQIKKGSDAEVGLALMKMKEGRGQQGIQQHGHLPMYIPHYRHWRANMHHIALLHQHLLRLLADLPQERFMEKLFLQQSLYTRVEVERCHWQRLGVDP